MGKHVTVLGSLYIAFSLVSLLVAAIVFVTLTGGGILSRDASTFLVASTFGTIISAYFAAMALPALIGGIGLLKYRGWARILVLVLGFLNLLNIPFGTVLGGYTIWVLLNDDVTEMFAGAGRRAGVAA